jgi:hypothetical protein
VKITCDCGALIVDSTDDLPHKAHFIPDQRWNALFEALDEQVIDALANRRLDHDAAYRRVRELLIGAVRLMWQCRKCGRLYIDDAQQQLHAYAPADEASSKEILRA